VDGPDPPARVLVIAAHPDDVDFGAGGTIAAWTAAGVEVAYCIVTDGGAGAADQSIDRSRLPALREAEQRAAAAELGVSEVVFLGYPDGELNVTRELRRDLSRVIRTVRPDRVLAQSPERNWDRIRASHPDHLAAGEAALRAVYPDARNPFAHPELLAEGLQPHTVPEMWLMASPHSGHAVDVTDTFEQKMAALRCHASQIADLGMLRDRLAAMLRQNASTYGLAEGRLAELFQVVATD
jgi:LmbE family N-acetylglucosaminyl deacetylase